MIVIAVGCLYLFIKTIFVPDHGGHWLLYIPLSITLGYMCLKYLHEWYHYFNITAPSLLVETGSYSVDIFTTYCEGEPLAMLETTLEAMSLIRYPHTSWCCDEADDPLVKDLCGKYGIRHIVRKERTDAKAGNINNALRYATGEICVILDPDHIPAPEFLDIVLPYFENEKVGFVQVVQAYYNHQESLVAKGAAQQTYQFYGPMMMCMYAYGTVQALGANCTFRRTALDSIGGHAAGLAEDMHTAMKLHAKGWRSVYVPAVIARGLVPATLSGYYKQQLKWARGTFELLVSTYPKLFKDFTAFQKLHYFLLPFHYLSGFIFLLNFLIPVFSLFLAESPLLLDFSDFVLAALPLAFMIVLIRQYVQKWVVEENERGVHMVGGLLQIGTWWVHLAGLIYTLIRKKVPYIPTPKNDVTTTPFSLHIPNLLIILLSAIAIVYGLNYDWTPFSLFMSGLAFTNICILLFVIYASYKTNRQFSNTRPLMKTKRRLWYFRHWAYKVARNYAIVFTILVVAGSIYAHKIYNSEQKNLVEKTSMQIAFYKGIFQPDSENGISQTSDILSRAQGSIQIVSYYIAWTDSFDKIALPLSDIGKLYEKHIVPLITLEPWLNRKPIFDQIVSGEYDAAIDSIAKQFAQLDMPVFFRFAHEPENPRYPWSFKNDNKPSSFIAAWRYLHKKFDEANAKKLIWIWNPWKADSIEKFFPGESYVDWLGVNILDYSSDNHSTSLEDLYQPFHNDSIFKLGLPVM
ncbi:MAG: glycosyltransferase, partial [Chitinophagaceae bacterium]|nr:glycosyltransferase [Chitinophagaceae bacterium]